MKNNIDNHRKLDIHRTLMGTDVLKNDWNLCYGLTQNRKESLLKERDHKNSFFNLNSENSLTLFIFGNLDDWIQVDDLKTKPRDGRSRWTQDFFDNIRAGYELYNNDNGKKKLFENLLEKSTDLADIDSRNSVLLFEFGIMNSAFHGGDPFRKLSFLDLSGMNRWVKFDAVLILPFEKMFVFFESKLDSDISRSTKKYPKINQIIKGLESAFLLTNHEDSLYDGWDFRYILNCPRVINEYDLTYYNYINKYTGKNLVKYNDLINKEYPCRINESCYPQYFGGFVKEVRDKISMIYWDDLAEILCEEKEDFFVKYLDEIEDEIDGRRKYKAIKNRFKSANIDVN